MRLKCAVLPSYAEEKNTEHALAIIGDKGRSQMARTDQDRFILTAADTYKTRVTFGQVRRTGPLPSFFRHSWCPSCLACMSACCTCCSASAVPTCLRHMLRGFHPAFTAAYLIDCNPELLLLPPPPAGVPHRGGGAEGRPRGCARAVQQVPLRHLLQAYRRHRAGTRGTHAMSAQQSFLPGTLHSVLPPAWHLVVLLPVLLKCVAIAGAMSRSQCCIRSPAALSQERPHPATAATR